MSTIAIILLVLGILIILGGAATGYRGFGLWNVVVVVIGLLLVLYALGAV